MEVCLFSCFRWCGYSWGAWVSFVIKDKFSVRVTKLLQGSVPHEPTAYLSAFNLLLTQCIMFILSKGCKPDSFVPHSSLKLSFTNIRGLGSNFDEFESFLESNSPDILALCETNLDDSTDWLDSGNLDGLLDHLRDVLWENIFKLSASTAASELFKRFQVGIDVYIPNRKWSQWFSAACGAAIAQWNHFFVCTNRINLLNLK